MPDAPWRIFDPLIDASRPVVQFDPLIDDKPPTGAILRYQ
jgi:hypothetical protein